MSSLPKDVQKKLDEAKDKDYEFNNIYALIVCFIYLDQDKEIQSILPKERKILLTDGTVYLYRSGLTGRLYLNPILLKNETATSFFFINMDENKACIFTMNDVFLFQDEPEGSLSFETTTSTNPFSSPMNFRSVAQLIHEISPKTRIIIDVSNISTPPASFITLEKPDYEYIEYSDDEEIDLYKTYDDFRHNRGNKRT